MGTDYLLKSARNASRLYESIVQIEQSQPPMKKPLLAALEGVFDFLRCCHYHDCNKRDNSL